MTDVLVEQMKSPISVLRCYYTQPSEISFSSSLYSSSKMAELHIVGGDDDGNVIIYDEYYNVLSHSNVHHHSKVTAMSPTYKFRPVQYISTGGEDGSVGVIHLKERNIKLNLNVYF